MIYADVEILDRMLPFVNDLNGKELTKWFSPLHRLAYHLIRDSPKYKEVASFLIAHGANLHLILDKDPAYGVGCSDQTPLSQTMEYSKSFFELLKILLELRIDIPALIEKELNERQKTLVDAGWTQETLQQLFDLQYKPLEKLRRCPECSLVFGEYFRERSWLNMLKRLKERTDNGYSIEEILEIRDCEIVEFNDAAQGICRWKYCEIGKANLARESKAVETSDEGEESEEDDSPFLLSI